jgi:hypothetical protein
MLQKNHHFLFPETYFGSLEKMEEEDKVDECIHPWILILEQNDLNQFQQKIGLFIHWSEYSE